MENYIPSKMKLLVIRKLLGIVWGFCHLKFARDGNNIEITTSAYNQFLENSLWSDEISVQLPRCHVGAQPKN